MQVVTGSTAGSEAEWHSADEDMGWSIGSAFDVINWAKEARLHFTFSSVANTTNGVTTFTWGKASIYIGVLTDKGIGIEIDNLALRGIVHDGTDLKTVNLNTTLVDNQVYGIEVVSSGNGNAQWFLDGILVGTAVGEGPSAAGPTSGTSFMLDATNGADSATQSAQGHGLRVYLAP
jgi:hypothetical protein